MAKVHKQQTVSSYYDDPDCRRRDPIGRTKRILIGCVRNRWIAMFVVAFAVSYSFHVVDERGERQLRQQQSRILCVIDGVATAQRLSDERVDVGAILHDCKERADK